MTYRITEVFHTFQGEGVRAGTVSTFVRFAKCNLKCSRDGDAGFDCDAEFESGRAMTLADIERAVYEAQGLPKGASLDELRSKCRCHSLVLTGGEPALQLDQTFCEYFKASGFYLAVETNGTIELPKREVPVQPTSLEDRLSLYWVDWITVSPKSAEHTIRQPVAHEVKYVRNADHAIPRPSIEAVHHVLSPAFLPCTVGSGPVMDRAALVRCMELCKENPQWRLSMQLHKFWAVR